MKTFRITIKRMLVLVAWQLGICRGLAQEEEFRIGHLSVHETNMIGSVNYAFRSAVTPHLNIVLGHPTDIVDGNWDTACWSYQYERANRIEVTLDLGREVNIGKLLYRPGQTESYTIETSGDGNAWTERHADALDYDSSSTIQTQVVNGAYSARYFLYKGQNGESYKFAYAGLFDFQVYELTPPPVVVVSFESQTNRYYTLQGCGNLQSGSWSNASVHTNVCSPGGLMSLQVTAPASTCFFRVIESEEP